MSLAIRLKTLREAHHMTQFQVGKAINVSRSTISGYETKGRQPSHEKLVALTELFHVSMDYLLGSDEEPLSQLSSLEERSEFDQHFFATYNRVSQRSKEDALKYLLYLEYCEKK